MGRGFARIGWIFADLRYVAADVSLWFAPALLLTTEDAEDTEERTDCVAVVVLDNLSKRVDSQGSKPASEE